VGSQFPDRHRAPEITVATCRRCGQEAEGETRYESMSYGDYPIGRAIHYCHACEDALMLSERPLDAVLADYLTGQR
jgi:hypothetical protein